MKSFTGEDLSGAVFRDCDLNGSRFVGVEMVDVEITGEVERLRVMGVDVMPYVEAELDRIHPVRPLVRSQDPEQLKQGWHLLCEEWRATEARIAQLPEARLREAVDGEWSALQTLRHLVYATDCWVRRGVLGEEDPWWSKGLPWSTDWDQAWVGIDRDADPSLTEVSQVRADRVASVTSLIDAATADSLAAAATGARGPGWITEDVRHTVGKCLRVVLNEEFWHLQFCRRDLDRLDRLGQSVG